MQNDEFKKLLSQKGVELYRDMPWRDDVRPYYVLVSELMLQQTQVSRVIPKFNAFINEFPDEKALASASLADVIKAWQGLGYNRRAKYLHSAAIKIVQEFSGIFPTEPKDVISLPGVGKNTLGAIEAYAFNQPSLFIETNIRTVYIHHFFNNQFGISDDLILQKLKETLDRKQPRRFYWTLMDYGAYLKVNGIKTNTQSRHYKKQPKLEGSIRQVRGQIIRELGKGVHSLDRLRDAVKADERFELALKGLTKDGLVSYAKNHIYLTK